MIHDHDWLESYSDMLRGKAVLELGCGSGIDTNFISRLACSLVSGDIEPQACVDGALELDHSKTLPFKDRTFDVVVASLCLHYFCMAKTKEVITEISRVLKYRGLIICRLNSYKDENYGAVGYPELEPGFYNVKGEKKRFFREEEIRELWSREFALSKVVHKNIDRYEEAKFVYEFSAIRL